MSSPLSPSLATFAPHPVCHHCSLLPSLLLLPTLCVITALSFPRYFCSPPCVSSLLSPSLATFAPHPVCHHCSLLPSLLLLPTLCVITALSFPRYFCSPPCVSSLLSPSLATFAPRPVCHHCSLLPSLLLPPCVSSLLSRSLATFAPHAVTLPNSLGTPTHLVASNYASGPVRIDLTSCGSGSSLIPPLATDVPSVTRY